MEECCTVECKILLKICSKLQTFKHIFQYFSQYERQLSKKLQRQEEHCFQKVYAVERQIYLRKEQVKAIQKKLEHLRRKIALLLSRMNPVSAIIQLQYYMQLNSFYFCKSYISVLSFYVTENMVCFSISNRTTIQMRLVGTQGNIFF